MSAIGVPFAAEDLERIAKHLRAWERLLVNNENFAPRAELIKRIEIMRPDDTDVIGHFVLLDGWVGFVPIGFDS